MSDCEICEALKNEKLKLFEDEKSAVLLSQKPAAPGHLLVVPKKHYPIIEQVPDYEISRLFSLANKASIALFESLNAQGTNIIAENGTAAGQKTPHFSINIIPRREGDKLNLLWKPRQLTEEEMSVAELNLKDNAKKIGEFEKEKKAPIELKKEPEQLSQKKESYLLKQLNRIP